MQSLDVISVNLWQILISLANLLILFLTIKKFLYAPVKNILAKRESEIENRYSEAGKAIEEANENRDKWNSKIKTADAEADSIISKASETAKMRGEEIVEDAKKRADSIIRRAENEAELEYRKAEEKIKNEIVEVSGILTEKLLDREIKTEDHRDLIDSFIGKLGDE